MNHYLKKFLILDDSCIAQHILNIYHFYYENLYYKYDIENLEKTILNSNSEKSVKYLTKYRAKIK